MPRDACARGQGRAGDRAGRHRRRLGDKSRVPQDADRSRHGLHQRQFPTNAACAELPRGRSRTRRGP